MRLSHAFSRIDLFCLGEDSQQSLLPVGATESLILAAVGFLSHKGGKEKLKPTNIP